MLVMVVFFIAFRWIHLSTPLIRLFLLVLILLLMPTLNFLPVCLALSFFGFGLPSRLPLFSYPSWVGWFKNSLAGFVIVRFLFLSLRLFLILKCSWVISNT